MHSNIAKVWNIGEGELSEMVISISISSTPETRFSESRFSEILDLMNKLQLPFSYFTLYSDSI